MKFKPVPPAPASLEAVARAQRAVPLVPGSEGDCCARLETELDLESRDVARTWLTFLRALELVVETESGFKRLRTEPTREHLRDRFPERVYGAEALLEMLDREQPLDAAEAYERFRERIPNWERGKVPDNWKRLWRERVEHLLEWLVLLEFAERTREGYLAAG